MNNDFKIHCIALCKNEADVINVCLLEAIKWADYIYVYDGGSTDGTWESVKKLNHSRIIPWKQDAKVFREELRAEVFNEFRHQSSKGDCWLQLIKHLRSWHATPSRKLPETRKAWNGYKIALKDRLLFASYPRGWCKKIKGVPFVASRPAAGGPPL